MISYDVGVIGGGVHGASAAFHLSRRDVSTVLFERGEAAGGPTGRSSAVCRAYYTDPFLAQVARGSLDLLADFAAHTGGRDAGFHRTGAMFLHGPDDVATVVEAAARLNAIGTRVDVLTPEDVAGTAPGFVTDDLGCGAFEADAGYADPVDTTVGLLAAARDGGVTVRLRTAVDRIEHLGAGGTRLHLSQGEAITVGRLLIAAGPWTRPLVRQVGVDLPLTVERHVVATCGWGRATAVPFAFADVPRGYYARPEIGDTLLIGPLTPAPALDDPDRFDGAIHDDEVADLAGRVLGRAPSLGRLSARGGWASLYDVSPDWQPVIGEVADGIVVDAGTSGHGFKLAPELGRYVADLVLGEGDPGLARFSPDRFTAGRPLAAGYGDAHILG